MYKNQPRHPSTLRNVALPGEVMSGRALRVLKKALSGMNSDEPRQKVLLRLAHSDGFQGSGPAVDNGKINVVGLGYKKTHDVRSLYELVTAK